ncbi:PREDICTED: sodium-coupled monocarboxylate transporter 1-like [Nicrophorus vespilloides]|uniref:Sodium-coupled monocarboxylate transporter 1-like n=1 Tax=Nicrophorus vespilloides TaxID=110193 RepID=A0ABM1ME40_NICVS|nr:PREDICTED: sodium-coupled monocarboxylate transporter 1-like [Nicrophorus vespilloides]
MDAINETQANPMHVTFSWYDYTFFSMMLGLSALIGVYFGFFAKNKQSSANEYLLGGKEMKVVPIAISLTASTVSGITLLAVPTDVYRFGATYWYYSFSAVAVYLITYYVYLPVFYKLQLTSSYEYLKLRFNGKIRILASFLYTIANLFYLPIVIYIPALAFAQATEVNIHYVTPLVCGVCIFYTTIGGLKAVVWTDTLQFVVMMGSMFAVLYMGIASVGGFGAMWDISAKGQRVTPDFTLDPTERDGFFAVLVGSIFGCASYISISQGFVQKYLSMPTKQDVHKALMLFAVGIFIIISSSVLTGLIMYAKYADCDPFTARKIVQHDQILPYYVMDVASSIPGLSGLFLSGIFSAALSTLSASMNCLSGSIYEDFISPFMSKDISQKRVSNYLKLIVFIIGLVSTILVFVVERMGSILPFQFSLGGITAGPLLGLFSLGMLFPTANSKGAMSGGIGSLIIMSFIILGSQINKNKGLIYYEPKPLSIDGCNSTITSPAFELNTASEDVSALFRITHYYYAAMGTLLVLLIGLPVSYFTRNEEDVVDPDLISPVSKWMLKKEKGKYYDVKKALNIVHSEKC